MAIADQAAGQGQEGFGHEGGTLVASAQPLEAVQPSLDLPGHVAVDAQAAAVRLSAAGDLWRDATGAPLLAQRLAVIGPVGRGAIRPL